LNSANETTAGLNWTGHPLVDMGIATLVAFAERTEPNEVTLDDLERFAAYAEQAVFSPTLRSHASVLYTIDTNFG
jgi:CRISPR-associated protein Cst1